MREGKGFLKFSLVICSLFLIIFSSCDDVVFFTGDDTAVIVFDLQKRYTAGSDSDEFAEQAGELLKFSSAGSLPVFATYRNGTEGEYAAPAPVEENINNDTQTFVRNSYNALERPEFSKAMGDLIRKGRTKLVVFGSELDVSIVQTLSGLTSMGFDIFLLKDMIQGEELSKRVTLKRLEMSGVKIISQEQFKQSIEFQEPIVLPYNQETTKFVQAPFIKRFGNAIVLINLSYSASDNSGFSDGESMARKMERLLDFNNQIKTAIFAINDRPLNTESTPYGTLPDHLINLTGKADSIVVIDELKRELLRRSLTQIVLGGFIDSTTVVNLAKSLKEDDIQLFLMEDILINIESISEEHSWEAAYESEAIPTTLRTYQHEMLKTEDAEEWPRSWDPTLRQSLR